MCCVCLCVCGCRLRGGGTDAHADHIAATGTGTLGEAGLPSGLPAAGLATRLWAAAGDSIAHVLAAAAGQGRPAPVAAPASPWDPPTAGGASGSAAFLHLFVRVNNQDVPVRQHMRQGGVECLVIPFAFARTAVALSGDLSGAVSGRGGQMTGGQLLSRHRRLARGSSLQVFCTTLETLSCRKQGGTLRHGAQALGR